MPTTSHWHAYAYTGRSYPDSAIRRREVPSNYPPIEIKHWLDRPRDHIVATFSDITSALDWQTAGNNVVYGYYTEGGQYVSRALISCPHLTPGQAAPRCPEGKP